jgi:hypothetical protein
MEKLTNEMVEMFGNDYQIFKNQMLNSGIDSTQIYTFEQYVATQLRIRKFKIERAREYNGKTWKEKA